jgi:hypothetical protein
VFHFPQLDSPDFARHSKNLLFMIFSISPALDTVKDINAKIQGKPVPASLTSALQTATALPFQLHLSIAVDIGSDALHR